jgi:putative aminopeptidase FrvX
VTIPPLLDELLRASAPSGSESDVMAIVRREANGFASVSSDVHGNTSARVEGRPGGRTLALFAHADEIGMIVTHVHEDGLASVGKIANWDAAGAVGKRVEVRGRGARVPGVVVRVAGGDGDPSWTDLRLDIGAADGDAALALIEPGDPATMTGDPVVLDAGRLMSKSLDNRVGVYAALEAARRLAAEPAAWDVALVVTALEEGSLRGGAAVAARAAAPDAAIVFEVTYAADVAGGDPGEWGNTRLGAGPTVFRGPTIHPAIAAGLRAAAAEAGIAVTAEAGDNTWSDSEAVQETLAGVPVGLVSVPLRYMHTPHEIVQLSDVEAASRLVEAYVRGLPLETSFLR